MEKLALRIGSQTPILCPASYLNACALFGRVRELARIVGRLASECCELRTEQRGQEYEFPSGVSRGFRYLYHDSCQPGGHAFIAFYALGGVYKSYNNLFVELPNTTQGWICCHFGKPEKHNNRGRTPTRKNLIRVRAAITKRFPMQEIPSFSDFADISPALSGTKMRIDQVLNQPIIIRGHRIIPSKKNAGEQCLHLQFEISGELCVLFTGSGVLINQCEKYADKIPFRTTIIKPDKYFSFS
ncbi:MAG: hypothetical protein LBK26_01435 [Rickettsiales bacterium]|jgi:hypothetical protein|nr:hypothetical protein [Rickettsiales bacterium]